MVVDEFGAAVPLGAGIAERADELLLLSTLTEGAVVAGAAGAQVGDVPDRSRFGFEAPASLLWLTRNE